MEVMIMLWLQVSSLHFLPFVFRIVVKCKWINVRQVGIIVTFQNIEV